MSAERDELGKSWKMWGGILGFIIVLVILSVFLLPKNNQPTDQAADNSAVPSPTASAVVPSSSDDEGTTVATPTASSSNKSGDCPALSTDAKFPAKAPNTSWEVHPSGMYLPVSKDFGPAKRDGEFWRCFSQTPSGAVFAGINLLADLSMSYIKDAAVSSPERDALVKSAKENPASGSLRVTGYRVVESGAKAATVDYLSTSGDTEIYMRMALTWDEKAGDWRWNIAKQAPLWKAAENAESFTSWE